jgi:hypothetical protein
LPYAEIARNLSQSPGIEDKDTLIILNEQPLDNRSVYDGKCAMEIDLGLNTIVQRWLAEDGRRSIWW